VWSLLGRVLLPSCEARPRRGYPQHYCTLRMPVARPAGRYRRSGRPGKGPRDFGLDRDQQLAGVRQRAEIIQLPPATPALADRTLGAADRGARGRIGPGRVREHQRRTRQRRTRPDRGTEQELAWHTAVIPPAGPGVRRSAARGPAIRFARCWVLPPRPLRRCHRQVMPAADPRGSHHLSTVAVAALGERPGLGGRPDGSQDHLRHGTGIGDHGEVRRVDPGDMGVRPMGHRQLQRQRDGVVGRADHGP
jgi:hypothetical protein